MDKSVFCAVTEKGEIINFEEKRDGNLITLTLKTEQFKHAKKLRVLEEFTKANAGDDGFYILPRNLHFMGEFITRFIPRENTSFKYEMPMLSLFCMKKKDFCGVARIKRNYKFCPEVTVKDGTYSIAICFDFTKNDRPYEDIRIELIELPQNATYGDMARAERELRMSRGEVVSLKEKCKREAVEYARKYPLIRIRMGWKPVPSPVPHQNPDIEPDMLVACDFKRVRDFVDEMKRQGVEGAEIQLVGWNIGGHDGRWPQIFPADARLGGDEGLKETIEYVKKNGYRISLHTNLCDSYEIANCFSWADVVEERNRQYRQEGNWGGGFSYRVCPTKQLKNNRRDLPYIAELGVNGVHYTDCVSIIDPDDCHSHTHPCPTGKGAEILRQVIRESRDTMGAFSSEGGIDFAVGEIDYALYLTFGNGFGGVMPPVADEWIPLHELIYHGTLLYNPTSSTINYPIKPAADRTTMYLRGGKPSLYLFSKFRTGGEKNWMGEIDLTTTTDEDLRFAVKSVKDALDEYHSGGFDERQFVYMSDYQILDNGIEVAMYEDGTAVVGNFSDGDKLWRKNVIPAGEYKVIKI